MIPAPRKATSPERLSRRHFYEGGWCVHHDEPTETSGGREWCRRCENEFIHALAALEGGRR